MIERYLRVLAIEEGRVARAGSATQQAVRFPVHKLDISKPCCKQKRPCTGGIGVRFALYLGLRVTDHLKVAEVVQQFVFS